MYLATNNIQKMDYATAKLECRNLSAKHYFWRTKFEVNTIIPPHKNFL
jgi:hypothetical protein